MEPELIADYQDECGEIRLAPAGKKLYWVDIDRGRIFRFDPADGKSEMVYERYSRRRIHYSARRRIAAFPHQRRGRHLAQW